MCPWGIGTAFRGRALPASNPSTSIRSFMAWYVLISAPHHFSMLLRGTRALIPRLLMGRRMGDCDAFHFSQVQVLIRDRAEKVCSAFAKG